MFYFLNLLRSKIFEKVTQTSGLILRKSLRFPFRLTFYSLYLEIKTHFFSENRLNSTLRWHSLPFIYKKKIQIKKRKQFLRGAYGIGVAVVISRLAVVRLHTRRDSQTFQMRRKFQFPIFVAFFLHLVYNGLQRMCPFASSYVLKDQK